MRVHRILFVCWLILLLAACRAPAPPPTPTAVPTATPRATYPPTPTSTHTPTPEPTATSTPSPTAPLVQVEPTSTPRPGDEERTNVRDLPLGQAGNYVNVTFGYALQVPPTWYTGFGSRPPLVSFSNLDPDTHDEHSMRVEGCLIEVHTSPNIHGYTLPELRAQMPRGFPNAEYFDLDGEFALLVQRGAEEDSFDSEWVYVEHGDRLYVLTVEYAAGAGEICLPAWRNMLDTWQWFEPEFAVYRNTNYGYAISYPAHWYRFNPRERGIFISNQDPSGITDLADFRRQAMVVETDVLENPDGLPLKEWLAEQDWEVDLSLDIPLNGQIGVRILREGPSPEIQEVSGYFQGPLGRIYRVICRYPAGRRWELQPIANAIVYSFSF